MATECSAPTPGQPDPLQGTGYVALAKLAEGGTATVYEARHVGLGKPCVIKLLKTDRARDMAQVERMRFEAQTLARLAHPNITTVFDCGSTEDGRPFFVMEHLEGHTLDEEVRGRGHLPVAEAVALLQQLCAGLAAAHALGIVHRDIKLQNLFLADPGGARTLKILDFGIAKLMPDADPSRAPAPPAIKSQDGATIGTPQFLSPEQVMCRPVDARTDVYGATLAFYEMVSGRDPYCHHLDLTSLLRAHVAEPPRPPSEVAPQPIDPAIDDVVRCGLAKRPEDRYASAAELALALAEALALGAQRAPSPSPPSGVVERPPSDAISPADVSALRTVAPSARAGGLVLAALVALGAAVVAMVISSLLDRLRANMWKEESGEVKDHPGPCRDGWRRGP
jgi:serine/threonine-protein kinase